MMTLIRIASYPGMMALTLLASISSSAAAQADKAGEQGKSPGAGFTWSAGLAATHTSAGSQDWHETNAGVGRYFSDGSLSAEVLNAHRFGMSDTAWALDGYAKLWTDAYANVRYQHGANSRLYASDAWRAEVFQNVEGGWEFSAAMDQLRFADDVNLYSFGIGKYAGNFYLRLRHQAISLPGTHARNDRLIVRYYDMGDADNYVEFSASNGRSGEQFDLASGRQTTNAYGFNLVRYVTPEWSLRFGASLTRSSNSANERSVMLGLSRRWK